MAKTGDRERKRRVWQTERNIGNKMRDQAGKRRMEHRTRKEKRKEETTNWTRHRKRNEE
jgi:hypothetical protein